MFIYVWYISLKQRLPHWFYASFPRIFLASIFWITLFCFLIYTFTRMVVLITTCSSIYILVNSWWPSDSIWWQRSGPTLAQVMVCCLKAPSHCLNQCWLVRNVVWCTSNFIEMLINLIHSMCSTNSVLGKNEKVIQCYKQILSTLS